MVKKHVFGKKSTGDARTTLVTGHGDNVLALHVSVRVTTALAVACLPIRRARYTESSYFMFIHHMSAISPVAMAK